MLRPIVFLRPLAVLVLAAMPAFGQGGPLVLQHLGDSGPWAMRSGSVAGQVETCDAMMFTGSEEGLRFEYNMDSGSIGFSGLGSAAEERPIDVEMWFDDNRAESQVYPMALEMDPSDFPWRSYRSSNSEPDGVFDLFSNASSIHFAYLVRGTGEVVMTFPLAGSNQIFHKTIDCVQMPAAAPEPAPASEAATGAPYVIYGTCKLVVQGTTYVDMQGNCPIWMANDGSGGFWINTDRESYLGDYFAEIQPQGGGIAWGYWNAEKGATHAQSPLGEDFRLAKGGCWVNATAMVCAAK